MSYLKSKAGSVEEMATAIAAKNQPIYTKLEARTPDQQKAFDKQMKDFLAKGGKIQKVPAGKKSDPAKIKKGIKEELTPKQKKIDLNKNNKIDGSDLKKLRTEKFTVQVTKTDGGKFVHGSYKTEKEAQKWIDWYKTGNLSKMKAIKIIPESIDEIWGARKASGGKHGDKKFKKAEHEPKGQDIEERDGANTASRKGSIWKRAKKKRFGVKVGHYDPSMKEADEKEKASTADVPAIKKDNKPGVKIAKIRLKRDKMDGSDSGKQEDPEALKKQILTLQGQVNVLKTKIENEKNKVVKPQPNKETGEVPLTIGVAYKHLKDKMKKESLEHQINELNEKVNEGYEGNILHHLKDAGIDGEFRFRKLYVAKKDVAKAKTVLQKAKKDSDGPVVVALPPIVGEDVTKTLTGRKPAKVDTEPKINYSR